jgi:hypothetical protein
MGISKPTEGAFVLLCGIHMENCQSITQNKRNSNNLDMINKSKRRESKRKRSKTKCQENESHIGGEMSD